MEVVTSKTVCPAVGWGPAACDTFSHGPEETIPQRMPRKTLTGLHRMTGVFGRVRTFPTSPDAVPKTKVIIGNLWVT
ncbi:unnamed protein product [Notodromas monacha]|uniref:Uncharacterized protein n=1 Tax=Notodromas monacha TaxID=399045 RepID=A0A7R9BYH8_9CRUS|nr:unnamed protein product [Notodromas monacha]CAG0923721.1 unnamed protein product [Notodromas monacha]